MLAVFMLISEDIRIPFTLILFAVLADGMDGIIARRFGNPGGYLDELADVISFSIAPSMMIYVLTDAHFYVRVATCSIFLVCGMFHLIRYHFGEKRYFMGITTPSAALVVIILIYLSSPLPLLYSAILLVSILMVSNISYPRIKGYLAIVAALIIMVAIILGNQYDGVGLYFLLTGIAIYITLGPFYLKAKFSKQKKHSP